MNEESPRLTVDVIIEVPGGIILVERKYPPAGWAIPGGFVEYGETVEEAARREMREETSLDLEGLRQFHVYSDPCRDPRGHTVSVVFTAKGRGRPVAASDAKRVGVFSIEQLPDSIAFDHRQVLMDYARWRCSSSAAEGNSSTAT
jgi:ADP-ribose pyrophosphatase YjhB (NUDIX family)